MDVDSQNAAEEAKQETEVNSLEEGQAEELPHKTTSTLTSTPSADGNNEIASSEASVAPKKSKRKKQSEKQSTTLSANEERQK